MAFWVFMLLMSILIPIIMIIFGKRFRKAAPDKINRVFGYRTKRSMMNRDMWDYAHEYMGNLWFRWGIIMLPISVIIMLLTVGRSEAVVGAVGTIVIMAQIIPLIVCVGLTEKALKENFDDYGRRRL